MISPLRLSLALLALLAGLHPALAEPLALEVAAALASFDATGAPVVNVTLAPESARAFGAFTLANVGKRIEVRVDGTVVTAPVIREPIAGGTIMISGSMTADDAGRLAMRLRGGAPVEVEAVE